jgi:hypothetical protein
MMLVCDLGSFYTVRGQLKLYNRCLVAEKSHTLSPSHGRT